MRKFKDMEFREIKGDREGEKGEKGERRKFSVQINLKGGF